MVGPAGQHHNDGSRRKVALDAEEDPELRYQVVNIRDLPVREHFVTANCAPASPSPLRPEGRQRIASLCADPMEICLDSEVGHTSFNGATRQIPNTQSLDTRNGNPIPSEEDEPLWMKMSVTCPCPAGSVMLRDSRVRSLPALLTSECH